MGDIDDFFAKKDKKKKGTKKFRNNYIVLIYKGNFESFLNQQILV